MRSNGWRQIWTQVSQVLAWYSLLVTTLILHFQFRYCYLIQSFIFISILLRVDKHIWSMLINLLPECSDEFRRQPTSGFWLHAQDSKILWALIKFFFQKERSWRITLSFKPHDLILLFGASHILIWQRLLKILVDLSNQFRFSEKIVRTMLLYYNINTYKNTSTISALACRLYFILTEGGLNSWS